MCELCGRSQPISVIPALRPDSARPGSKCSLPSLPLQVRGLPTAAGTIVLEMTPGGENVSANQRPVLHGCLKGLLESIFYVIEVTADISPTLIILKYVIL